MIKRYAAALAAVMMLICLLPRAAKADTLEGLFAGKFRAGSQIFDCFRTKQSDDSWDVYLLNVPYGCVNGTRNQFDAGDLTGKYFRFVEADETVTVAGVSRPVVGLYLYNVADDSPAYVAGKMPVGGNGLVIKGTVEIVADEGVLFISDHVPGYDTLGYFVSNAAGYAYTFQGRIKLRSNKINEPDLEELKEYDATEVLLEPNQILLRFYPNGDHVTGMPQDGYLIKQNGVDFPIAASLNPSRPNYTFVSWNSKADGSGTTYEPGAVYKSNTGIKLYAQWRSSGGTPQTQSAPTGVAVAEDRLTNTTALMQYRTADDPNTWHWCMEGSTPVEPGEYWVRYAPQEGQAASPESYAGTVYPREPQPSEYDFTITHVSTHGGSDGAITPQNTNRTYQYLNNQGAYADFPGGKLENLSAGEVQIRVKAGATTAPSLPLTLTIKQPAAGAVAPSASSFTISHVTTNGGWDGVISGLTLAMEYQSPWDIGSDWWSAVSEWDNGSISYCEAGEYRIRFKGTDTELGSPYVSLWVKQPAPEPNVGARDAGTGGNGAITGTTGAMEYRLSGATDWQDCSATETSVPPGVYIVRYKMTDEYTTLPEKTVTVSGAPLITTQPADQCVPLGRPATFTVVAAGQPAPSYQWQLDDGSGWTDIQGATSASYTTPNTSMNMQGNQYRCLVKNITAQQNTVTSDAASLTLTLPVTLTPRNSFVQGNAPADLTATVGRGLDITFTANFDSATMNGAPIADGTAFDGENGSIVLRFRQDYLNTLAPGSYTLRITTRSGAYAETAIMVAAPGEIPQAGDGAHPLLWAGLTLLAGVGLIILRRRRKASCAD